MLYYIFIGVTINKANKTLTEDEISILNRNKICIKEIGMLYLLYYNNRIVQRDISDVYELSAEDINSISLQSHELHHFQGCLKRTPLSLYTSYNNDFGFQQIAASATKPKPKPKATPKVAQASIPVPTSKIKPLINKKGNV